MNKSELRQILVAEDFSKRAYSLGDSYADEALCLRHEENSWVVFYSERGLETGKVSFDTEAAACEYFLSTMRSDPTTRESWSTGFGYPPPSDR